MEAVLRFSDIACLNESAAGSLGAGLATLARAEFPVVRGFVVAPVCFSDFIKKEEIGAALDLHEAGAEDPKESWRNVKAVFRRARIFWKQEMEILAAFNDMGSVVSMVTSSKFGSSASRVYAGTGQDLLDGIKHCWLRWLKSNMGGLDRQDMPAVIVRQVLDSEASLELRKKNRDINIRAVFGLPEGLEDPKVSGDIYRFGSEGLEHMEQRNQELQYIMGPGGPVRVELDAEFGNEEKATGQMLGSLDEIMGFMRNSQGLERCRVCFLDSRPVVCSAALMSLEETIKELPSREHSLVLTEKRQAPEKTADRGPVIAARLFVKIESKEQIDALNIDFAPGILVPGTVGAGDMEYIIGQARRKLNSTTAIMEMTEDMNVNELAAMVAEKDMKPGIMIPGIRSAQELAKIVAALKDQEGADIWARIMYPSNLFFIKPLSKQADIMALDLEMLGRLLLGAGEDGKWLGHSLPALVKALDEAVDACGGERVAVVSGDLVSTPALLESLVRKGVGTICVEPGDFNTVRHIVASVEKRVMLENGRG